MAIGALAGIATKFLGSAGAKQIAGQGLMSALNGGLGNATGGSQGSPGVSSPGKVDTGDVPQIKSSADVVKKTDWNGE